MNLQTRLKQTVTIELSALTALTLIFLLVFPARPIFADVGLALLALILLVLNIRYTKNTIWRQFPPSGDRCSRMRKAYLLVGSMTTILVTGLFATGLILGHREGGWEAAVDRVGNWHFLPALALYFPWALLQQALFQFYLLGRLRIVLPSAVAISCTGIIFALVHLPDVAATVAAAVAGVFWVYVYDRYRMLSPLALSHALLGTTFYYWICGRDLAGEWAVLP